MIPADPKKYTMKEAHCFLFYMAGYNTWQLKIKKMFENLGQDD